MADYYELLGIARDASTDEIRTAYRNQMDQVRTEGNGKPVAVSDPAALNQAWNVLADPFQRRRYDERLRTDEQGDGAGGTQQSVTVNVTANNEASTPAPARRGWRQSMQQGASQRAKRQTIQLPAGLTIAAKRPRVFGSTIDLLVLYLLCWGLLTGAQAMHGVAGAVISYLAALLIGLGYLVVPTVRSGRTLGKRIAHTRIVSLADGSVPGWQAALRRYGPAILLALSLPQLGVLLSVFLAITYLSDPNSRSLLDKFAGTIVVADRAR